MSNNRDSDGGLPQGLDFLQRSADTGSNPPADYLPLGWLYLDATGVHMLDDPGLTPPRWTRAADVRNLTIRADGTLWPGIEQEQPDSDIVTESADKAAGD
ncbi:hypothetical protein B0A48_00840 [Cryoendolithus antarcticus]|uniref:Uncharacterized protein n=1 Tax=Cryoendolithus antarcticus TaxID=1507870 RepID=A0A1V8TRI3_9PEZI|nr:hypothetical protein B0A48_00840 [Cryoendolithus antarcticus]